MRVVITVLSFIAFLGIVFWAYSGRQKERFNEAANLPFADEEMQQRTVQQLQADDAGVSNGTSSNSNQSTTKRSNGTDEVTHG